MNAAVPRTLQFHEDEDDCNNCDNTCNEANDELMENDEHLTVTRTHVEVYDYVETTGHSDENSDYPNENCNADVNKQIKLSEIGEASGQLPGEVCHM